MAANDIDTTGERVDGPPPPSHSGTPLWHERWEQAKAEPGQWFRYGPYSSSSIIRTAKNNAENMGLLDEAEATTRKREDGDYDLYIMYRGEGN